jgi:hypothetical protein
MSSNPDAEPDFHQMEPMNPTITKTIHHHSVIPEEENVANIRAEVASMPPLPGGGFTFFSSTVNRPDHQQDLDFDSSQRTNISVILFPYKMTVIKYRLIILKF